MRDARIGWGFSPTSKHYVRTIEQNFLENPGFDHGETVAEGIEPGLTWSSWSQWDESSVFSAELDPTQGNLLSGLASQRLDLVSVPSLNLREYLLVPLLAGHEYVFTCQMRQNDLSSRQKTSPLPASPVVQTLLDPPRVLVAGIERDDGVRVESVKRGVRKKGLTTEGTGDTGERQKKGKECAS